VTPITNRTRSESSTLVGSGCRSPVQCAGTSLPRAKRFVYGMPWGRSAARKGRENFRIRSTRAVHVCTVNIYLYVVLCAASIIPPAQHDTLRARASDGRQLNSPRTVRTRRRQQFTTTVQRYDIMQMPRPVRSFCKGCVTFRPFCSRLLTCA
jgi:hypothetical protein